MYKTLFILLLLITSSSFARGVSKTIITVTHPVQEYFLKQIADNRVYIRTVYDKTREFKIDNKQIINRLSSSDYYFRLNLKEEELILNKLKSKNSDLKVVNIAKNIGNLKLKNGDKNPYIWMDPILVRDLATNIYDELVKIRYFDRLFFKENLERFLSEIDEIYLHLRKRISESGLYGFFTFDNQLDYFAKRYRLEIYYKKTKYLSAKEVATLTKFIRKEPIQHIIIPKNSKYLIAQSLGSHINGKIIEIDIYDRNWKSNLYKLVRALTNY